MDPVDVAIEVEPVTGRRSLGLKEPKPALPRPQGAHTDARPSGELTDAKSHPIKVGDLYKKYKDSSLHEPRWLDSRSS
jgi:hypothetical protein